MDKKPLYKKLIDYYCVRITLGALKPGDKLPSIRKAETIHNVSSITVMTAYSELEKSGIIDVKMGKGHYVSRNAATAVINISRIEIKNDTLKLIKKTSELGFSRNDVINLINMYWGEVEKI